MTYEAIVYVGTFGDSRMAAFSREIKRERKRLGMSQGQLAEALGTASHTVSRWERGAAVPAWADLVLEKVRKLRPVREKRFGIGGRPKKKGGRS